MSYITTMLKIWVAAATEITSQTERAKLTAQVATKTIVVNGGKDEYLNLEVNNNLTLLPRTQVLYNYMIRLLKLGNL